MCKSARSISGKQTITFQQQETTESRSRIRAAWASFCRYKQELTSRSYPSAAQVTLVKYGALSYIGLRVWNMDLDKRTRKIDTINKTEDASTNCTNQKKIQKKMASNMKIRKATFEKEKKAKRTPKAKHKKEAALTPIATKIATSLLQKTQTKILNEGGQDSVFDRNTQKNEMAIGDENSIATRRTMGKESCRIRTQDLVQKSRHAEQWVD